MTLVKTLTFSEESKGWTSFWSYEPRFAFSLAGNYLSINGSSLYEHYTPNALHSNFYGVQYDADVTLVLNDNPSTSKNFKTLNYEGTNGWEAVEIEGDEYSPSANDFGNISVSDTARDIASYAEGRYFSQGAELRHGFNIKDNKYYAPIKNNSPNNREGQISSGASISGIKGFFMKAKLKTDETTAVGGRKQLFSVGSEYSISLP